MFVKPRIALSGVLISWLIFAKKFSFTEAAAFTFFSEWCDCFFLMIRYTQISRIPIMEPIAKHRY